MPPANTPIIKPRGPVTINPNRGPRLLEGAKIMGPIKPTINPIHPIINPPRIIYLKILFEKEFVSFHTKNAIPADRAIEIIERTTWLIFSLDENITVISERKELVIANEMTVKIIRIWIFIIWFYKLISIAIVKD